MILSPTFEFKIFQLPVLPKSATVYLPVVSATNSTSWEIHSHPITLPLRKIQYVH